MRKAFHLTAVVAASMCVCITSCKKQTASSSPAVETANGDPVALNAVNGSFTVDWNNQTPGYYTLSEAVSDFGNLSGGWDSTRTYISEHYFRIKLLKDTLSGAGGIISKIDVVDASEYELDFDVKFHSQFDFSRGGKIGFGFLVGDGNSGGDPGWDGNGGSFRLMWYGENANRVYFQPYLYYRDQEDEYGDTFDQTYPATGSLVRGHWYHVHMYIKSNTGTSTNGRALLSIDGTTILDKAIRWTTNDSKRLINRVCLSTFRGGSQEYWESPTDGYIYFDNLVVNKISN